MKNTTYGVWAVDVEGRTCWNTDWDIIVAFDKQGKVYAGKIDYMPEDLLKMIAGNKNGHELLKRVVMEAEMVFMDKIIKDDIEGNGSAEKVMLIKNLRF